MSGSKTQIMNGATRITAVAVNFGHLWMGDQKRTVSAIATTAVSPSRWQQHQREGYDPISLLEPKVDDSRMGSADSFSVDKKPMALGAASGCLTCVFCL